LKKLHLMTEEKLNRMVEERLVAHTQQASDTHERELLMKQANIRSLQAQINPHFLYNALECIRAQAILDGADEIASITKALSLFFRYNISNKGDHIPLKDEFENVRNYMLIQQYRYKDRMTLDINYDDQNTEILDMLLPKLVLQPLVENSIVHGFSDMLNGARIIISATKVADHISIKVVDNGKGMDLEELTALKEKLRNPEIAMEEPSEQEQNGIALVNVNRRIQLFYGQPYSLNITSCVGEGTEIELFLPRQKNAGTYGR